MNSLFVVSEIEGLVKTGGLADVARALPAALRELGHDVRVVVPFYKLIRDGHSAAKIGDWHTIYSNQNAYAFELWQLQLDGLPVYAIDMPRLFERDGIYGDGYHAFHDNPERFAFFAKAALATAQILDFRPDIVHCNDWHTGLTPYYMRHFGDDFFAHSKSVLTIHNGAYQGIYHTEQMPFTHDQPELGHRLDHPGNLNFLKIGIEFADKINAVSPHYASELLTPLGSHHLFNEFKRREADVSGILNGCDYTHWNPQTDPYIAAQYDADNMHKKSLCKSDLQRQAGLQEDSEIPVIGLVCRLTEQKGFAFLVPALWQLLHQNVQVIIVGTGEPAISEALRECAAAFPQKLSFTEGFSNQLAHSIEAGSDFFLMPSLFEPCGLNQMYSLAYGTIPIVREVGGLKDTVVDPMQDAANATGFVFDQPDSSALLLGIYRALLCYHAEPTALEAMKIRGMNTKFTWQAAAHNYLDLYQQTH